MGDGSNPHHFLDMCALGELAHLQELMATTRRARVAIKPFSPCGVSVKWKVHITTRHLMKAAMNAAECNGHEAVLVYLREHSERLALDLKPKAPIDKIWEGGNVERIDLGVGEGQVALFASSPTSELDACEGGNVEGIELEDREGEVPLPTSVVPSTVVPPTQGEKQKGICQVQCCIAQ